MSQSKHASQEDLWDLIQGDGDSSKARRIGEHIHHCQVCRQALDALTAQSNVWKKAPVFLKEATSHSNLHSGVHGRGHDSDSMERTRDEGSELVWEYPIQELLEKPKHPEMMGRIGKYDIEREVGRGGMGVVLKAHDAELNRPVAIKVLAPHLASHATARRRFAQEAIAAAGVLHPNVIAVHGVSNEGKIPYIVMPYIDGPSLQNLVDQHGPLTEIEIVRIAMQISAGLAAAHSQGLVHRDIKPANILVETGVQRVMITDFGLARAEDDASLTRTGWLTGTPNYMSPEQTKGQRADHRSDLFSLGSLIYFLATGRLPFRAETPLGVLHRIQHDQPTPVRQVNHQISRTLSDLITLLLAKSPDDRCQSANELHEMLEKYLAHLHQPDHSKPPRFRRSGEQTRRRRQRAMVAMIVLATLSSMAIGYSGIFQVPFALVDASKEEPDSLVGMLTAPSSPSITELESDSDDAPNMEQHAAKGNEKKSKALLDDEPSPGKLFAEALCLYQMEKLDESLAAFRITATFDEYKALSNYNIACIRARLGDIEKAFMALEKAVEYGFVDGELFRSDDDLDPLRGDPRFSKIEARLEVLEKADKLLSLAVEEAGQKNFPKAEELCRQVLEIDPKNDDAVVNLGYALHMQKKYDEAMPWHERAANSSKCKALGNFNLSCWYCLKGDSEKAISYLENAIQSGLARCLDVESLEKDPDLDGIRHDPRYEAAVKKMGEWQYRPVDIQEPGIQSEPADVLSFDRNRNVLVRRLRGG